MTLFSLEEDFSPHTIAVNWAVNKFRQLPNLPKNLEGA